MQHPLNHPRTRLVLASLAIAGLTLGACGGSDGASSSDRDKVVDQLITEAGNDGATVDRDCASAVVKKLSDADVKAILAAGPNGDAKTSADADKLALELVKCVKDFGTALDGSLPDSSVSIPAGLEVTDALIDQIAASIEASGAMTVDRACLKDALAGMDMADISAKASDPAFLQQYVACLTPTS